MGCVLKREGYGVRQRKKEEDATEDLCALVDGGGIAGLGGVELKTKLKLVRSKKDLMGEEGSLVGGTVSVALVGILAAILGGWG